MAQQIQIRRDTSTNWTAANPILAQGELGLETNTNKVKIGDGTTAWNSLNYFGGAGALASLSDVTVTSLASGQVLIANASSIFINQSLSSLVNELVSFSSLGSLAVMNQLSFTSLTNQPSLSSLAFQSTIDYTTSQIINKPSLGSLAVMNQLSFTSLLNQPSLGSLAEMNALSFTSLLNQPSLSSLAFQATVDYSQITNTPSLGSLAVMNQLSFSSLLNQPSLGSLAYLSSISQIHLPSTASFNNLTINGLQVNSTASINQIRSTGFVTGTATIADVNSGVYNLYESGVQKAIFDGTFGGRFRANASGESFLFENYKQMSQTNSLGQEVWKVDDVNFIIGRTLFANVGSQNFGNANATTLTAQTVTAQVVAASNISVGTFNTSNLIAQGILASMVSASDVYASLLYGDTVYGGVGNFDSANASTLNFDTAFGNYVALGTGVGANRVLTLSDINNATFSYIGFNEGSSEKWVVGTQTGEFGIFDTVGNTFRMTFEPSGEVGVGTVNPTGQLDVEQLSTTAARPTLELTQSDLSEEFINFVATPGATNPIIASSTATTFSHKVRVAVNGTFKWLYLYNA